MTPGQKTYVWDEVPGKWWSRGTARLNFPTFLLKGKSRLVNHYGIPISAIPIGLRRFRTGSGQIHSWLDISFKHVPSLELTAKAVAKGDDSFLLGCFGLVPVINSLSVLGRVFDIDTKMMIFRMYLLSDIAVLGVHVKFRGCILFVSTLYLNNLSICGKTP